MKSITDLTGRKFTRWTVLKYDQRRGKKSYWICVCECGIIKSIRASHLVGGTSRSCGCLFKDIPNHKTHGQASRDSPNHDIYKIWRNIKTRCFNPNCEFYHRYGGRGITIFSEWIDSFEKFQEYVGEYLGPRPSKQHTIDRIDNNGNYEPGNIRWATKKQQAQNRRKPKLLIHCTDQELLDEVARRNLIPNLE